MRRHHAHVYQGKNGVITDVKFNTFWLRVGHRHQQHGHRDDQGKPIEEALTPSNKAVVEALDGLPPTRSTAQCWPRRRSRPPSGLLRQAWHRLRPGRALHRRLRLLPRPRRLTLSAPFIAPQQKIFSKSTGLAAAAAAGQTQKPAENFRWLL